MRKESRGWDWGSLQSCDGGGETAVSFLLAAWLAASSPCMGHGKHHPRSVPSSQTSRECLCWSWCHHFILHGTTLKAASTRPGLQTPCLVSDYPKATGSGAILSWPVFLKQAHSKSRYFPGAPSSLPPAILLVYLRWKHFLWACVVGLDFAHLTLKQPVWYLAVEIPTLDHGGGVHCWVGGTGMLRSPQAEDGAEAVLHKLDEHSNR